MRNLFKISLALILLSATALAADQELNGPAIRATVDRRAIYIGDRLRYKIEVAAGKGTEVRLPKFADGLMGDFEIKDSGTKTTKGVFAKKIDVYWYDITVYSVGRHTIPPIEIQYKQKSAKDWAVIKTAPIDITAGSVWPRGLAISDIKDIKGPLHFLEINWILVSAVVVFLILGAGVFLFYKAKKAKAPIKLPHETALEEIEAAKTAYARGGDVKEYYVGMSDCVRRYIERVFNLKAPEMTTEEFLNSLRESQALSLEQKDLLKEFLNACDLVKFAKYKPTGDEMETVYKTAKRFVEETKGGGAI